VKNFYASIAEYNNIVENLESQDIENFLEPLVDKNMIKKIKVFQLREPYNENIFAEHGKTNMLLAIAASIAFDLNIGKIFEGIKKYAGLPYRMQVVGRKNNIEFINDTTATVPEAVAASILALAKSRNIVLIAGGVDKKLPANSMVRAIVENVCRLYLLEGSGSQLIEDELLNLNYLTFESGFRDLKQLVEKIFNDLKKQDASLFTNIDLNKPIAILLSPGFASFNLFINEFNRGDIFNDAVQKLISQK
jgi:UDP-N-acetylmuramoylalanine--D-glutamate ligase